MRFKNKMALRGQRHEYRTVKKFLWLPKSFDEEKTRWLEYAYIKQQVRATYSAYSYCIKGYSWKDVGFDDNHRKKIIIGKIEISDHNKPGMFIVNLQNLDYDEQKELFGQYRNDLTKFIDKHRVSRGGNV